MNESKIISQALAMKIVNTLRGPMTWWSSQVASKTEWQKSGHSFKRTVTGMRGGISLKMRLLGCSRTTLCSIIPEEHISQGLFTNKAVLIKCNSLYWFFLGNTTGCHILMFCLLLILWCPCRSWPRVSWNTLRIKI